MLENILAWLSFLLFVIFHLTASEFNLNHLHTPQLQTRNFETAIEGKVLNSSLGFVSLNVSDEAECMFKCLLYGDCFSINLGPKKSELMLCELCSRERFSGLAYFAARTGYKHRSTVSSCSRKPCAGENVCIPKLQTTTSYLCWLPYIDIEIKGFGSNHTTAGGHATYTNSYFQINGKKYPLGDTPSRGHSFRVITYNGNITVGPRTTFDTHGDGDASTKMASYINAIPANSIVLVVVCDTGEKYSNTNALISIGATSPGLSLREAWAFVGFKGERKVWMVEKKTARYVGPVFVSTRIPCLDFLEL